MPAKDYKRTILDALGEALVEKGFRKKGAHFSRALADVVHLASLQSSVSSTSQLLRATVNLGVWVPALEGDVKPDSLICSLGQTHRTSDAGESRRVVDGRVR